MEELNFAQHKCPFNSNHMKRHFLSYFLVFTCTLFAFACTCCNKQKDPTEDASCPVQISRSLFHNGDSLRYYAALAYKDDDPKGLYVTAAASFLYGQDPEFPDSIYVISNDEAEIMLLRSAELGYPDAIQLIQCMAAQGCWHRSIPE